jgi:hypothetical protein
MRVLVCGGRDYNDYEKVRWALEPFLNPEVTTIIHGGATGADSLAGRWAEENAIPVEIYFADWNKYGKRAGYIRNVQMLNEGKPDTVIAFPGGKGTEMMINLARSAKVDVIEVKA